jgi:hypothetical protein|tara:strand:+ start:239 stop:529 length:291 start_codon:yes stop_codon:yes gene_type:complete
MKITLFTSNKIRHEYLISLLSKSCDKLFVIQESKSETTGNKLSEKLLTVWKNPDEWWNSKEVQKVRQEFCDEYAFLPNDYEKFFLEKISNQINHIN